jgi:hypothetical protein
MKAKHLNIALVGILLSLTSSATADNVKHESVISELFEQVSGLVPCAIPSSDFVPSSDEPRNDCLSISPKPTKPRFAICLRSWRDRWIGHRNEIRASLSL